MTSEYTGVNLKNVWYKAVLAGSLILGASPACGAPQKNRKAENVLTESKIDFSAQRERMVKTQLESRGISDPRVLAAMRQVPRESFVPPEYRDQAYDDAALPIHYAQTISQPYIVAYMTETLALKGDERVLEIGTGSGYQAAILSLLAREVFSMEIVEPLAQEAQKNLAGLGYKNITIKVGNGYDGWPEQSPFDCIIVTAAPPELPQKLVEQLKVGGRMVLPLGHYAQELVLVLKKPGGIEKRDLIPVRFVPMIDRRKKD
ncbi:MAG: protein-L-isoaspartate(D-aspartate) O-methyltransferase [Acidobacteriia bacterium]|nr:protein-L-isoaspartate(D-aspartate) O-methyltransferase [Terriglobia bacterium]